MAKSEKYSQFEALGEEAVRQKIATQEWQGTEARQAESWLQWRQNSSAKIIAIIGLLIALGSLVVSGIALWASFRGKGN